MAHQTARFTWLCQNCMGLLFHDCTSLSLSTSGMRYFSKILESYVYGCDQTTPVLLELMRYSNICSQHFGTSDIIISNCGWDLRITKCLSRKKAIPTFRSLFINKTATNQTVRLGAAYKLVLTVVHSQIRRRVHTSTYSSSQSDSAPPTY